MKPQKIRAHMRTPSHLPELVAEGGDLSCHRLTAVRELLELPLQLPLLGTGPRVLLLHLLQLSLQLPQSAHRLIQLQVKSREEEEEGQYRGRVEMRDRRKEGSKKKEKGQIFKKQD